MFLCALMSGLLFMIATLAERSRRDVVQYVVVLLIVVAGLIGPRYEFRGAPSDIFWFTVHPLSGLLLWTQATWQFRRSMSAAQFSHRSDPRQFVRCLSCNVYLVLYAELLAAVGAGLVRASHPHGAFDANLLWAYVNSSPGRIESEFQYEFRGYFGFALVAIMVIRGLAYLNERRRTAILALDSDRLCIVK
jgi:hypothetical protein